MNVMMKIMIKVYQSHDENHEKITLRMKRHEPRFRIFLRICMFDKCHIVVFDSTNHVPVLMPTLEQTQLRNKRYFLLLFPQT